MGRRLRHVLPGKPVEVTNRTFQARYLLRPTAELRPIVLGVLGRVQRQLEMTIHAFTFASNHFHLILSPNDAQHLSDFMGRFEGKLAKEVNRLTGWSGKVWGDRYHHITIEDSEEAQVERLRYVLAHGVKEGLTRGCSDWPGASCVRALTEGEPLRGRWYDRTSQHRATRWGREIDEEEFAEDEVVELTPLPCWAHLSEEEHRQQIQVMISEIEATEAARHRADGTRPAGVAKILAHHPHERPKKAKRSPQPWFHSRTDDGRKMLRDAYRFFAEAFRDAAEALKAGELDPPFPEGSFPPGRPFVPHPAPG